MREIIKDIILFFASLGLIAICGCAHIDKALKFAAEACIEKGFNCSVSGEF